jgi:hypothetical protein
MLECFLVQNLVEIEIEAATVKQRGHGGASPPAVGLGKYSFFSNLNRDNDDDPEVMSPC